MSDQPCSRTKQQGRVQSGDDLRRAWETGERESAGQLQALHDKVLVLELQGHRGLSAAAAAVEAAEKAQQRITLLSKTQCAITDEVQGLWKEVKAASNAPSVIEALQQEIATMQVRLRGEAARERKRADKEIQQAIQEGQRETAAARKETASLRTQLSDAQSREKAALGKVQELQASLSRAQEEAATHAAQATRLSRDLDTMAKARAVLEEDVRAAKRSAASVEQVLQEAREEASSGAKTAAAFKEEVGRLRARILTAESRAAAADRAFASSEGDLKAVVAKLNTALLRIAEVEEESAVKLRKAAESEKESRKEAVRCRSRAVVSERSAVRVTGHLVLFEAFSRWRGFVAVRRIAAAQLQVRKLEGRLMQAEGDLSVKQGELETLRRHHNAALSERKELSEKVVHLDGELARLRHCAEEAERNAALLRFEQPTTPKSPQRCTGCRALRDEVESLRAKLAVPPPPRQTVGENKGRVDELEAQLAREQMARRAAEGQVACLKVSEGEAVRNAEEATALLHKSTANSTANAARLQRTIDSLTQQLLEGKETTKALAVSLRRSTCLETVLSAALQEAQRRDSLRLSFRRLAAYAAAVRRRRGLSHLAEKVDLRLVSIYFETLVRFAGRVRMRRRVRGAARSLYHQGLHLLMLRSFVALCQHTARRKTQAAHLAHSEVKRAVEALQRVESRVGVLTRERDREATRATALAAKGASLEAENKELREEVGELTARNTALESGLSAVRQQLYHDQVELHSRASTESARRRHAAVLDLQTCNEHRIRRVYFSKLYRYYTTVPMMEVVESLKSERDRLHDSFTAAQQRADRLQEGHDALREVTEQLTQSLEDKKRVIDDLAYRLKVAQQSCDQLASRRRRLCTAFFTHHLSQCTTTRLVGTYWRRWLVLLSRRKVAATEGQLRNLATASDDALCVLTQALQSRKASLGDTLSFLSHRAHLRLRFAVLLRHCLHKKVLHSRCAAMRAMRREGDTCTVSSAWRRLLMWSRQRTVERGSRWASGLETRVTQLLEERTSLEGEVVMLRGELAALQGETAVLRERNGVMQRRVDDLEADHEALRAKHSLAEADRDEASSSLREAQKELAGLRHNLQDTERRLEEEKEAATRNAERADRLAAQLGDKVKELKERESEADSLRADGEHLARQNAMLVRKNEDEAARHRERYTGLVKEHRELDDHRAKQAAQIVNQAEKIAELEYRLQRLEPLLKETEAALERAEETGRTLSDELSRVKSEAASTALRTAAERTQLQEELEGAKVALQRHTHEAAKRVSHLQNTLSATEEELVKTSRALREAEEQRETLARSTGAATARVCEFAAALEGNLTTAMGRAGDLEVKSTQLADLNRSLKAVLDDRTAELEKATTEVVESRKRCEALEGDVEKLHSEVFALRQNISSLEAKAESFQSKAEEGDGKLSHLRHALSMKEDEAQKWKEASEAAESRAANLDEEVKSLHRRLRHSETLLTDLQSQVAQMAEDKEVTDRLVEQSERKMALMLQQLQAKDAEIKRCELSAIAADVDTLRLELNRSPPQFDQTIPQGKGRQTPTWIECHASTASIETALHTNEPPT
eukprot:Sspe_Gene.43471::Locus_21192_Transcript_1_1_Confidence_1.000_Length_4954::g.43471::m.43471